VFIDKIKLRIIHEKEFIMKIGPQILENNSTQPPKPPKQPKNKKERPKWLLPVGIVILIAGFVFMIVMPKSTPDKKPNTNQSEQTTTKTNKSSKAGESTRTSKTHEQTAPSESSESTSPSSGSITNPDVDMTPVITQFFTAFQEYSTEKDSPKSRADKMREVATDDAVSALIPNSSETGDQSESIAATYKFVKPIEIVADANVAGNYAVVLTYSVNVMENTNQYTDTYIIGTGGGKITSVSKRSSVMDN
jgi:cytoskeletal protein RodZ